MKNVIKWLEWIAAGVVAGCVTHYLCNNTKVPVKVGDKFKNLIPKKK